MKKICQNKASGKDQYCYGWRLEDQLFAWSERIPYLTYISEEVHKAQMFTTIGVIHNETVPGGYDKVIFLSCVLCFPVSGTGYGSCFL